MRTSIHTRTISTGIALAASALLLMTPAAMAGPDSGPCPDGSTSCLDSPYWADPPAGATQTQLAMYCLSRQMSNQKYGTTLEIPQWCHDLDKANR